MKLIQGDCLEEMAKLEAGSIADSLSVEEQSLIDYIGNRKYLCCYCRTLQEDVVMRGLNAIDEYGGMVCACIEDMQMRLSDVRSAKF